MDHEKRRAEITYAVWYLISTQGIQAVTQRAVAAEAGISVGRIQHYFASKEEMVRYGCRALVESAEREFGGRTSGTSPAGAFRELVLHTIPQTEAHRTGTIVWYAYLARSAGDEVISTILKEAKHGEHEEAVRLLEQAQKEHQVSYELDAEEVASRLLAEADGLAMRVLVGVISAQEAVGILEKTLNDVLTVNP